MPTNVVPATLPEFQGLVREINPNTSLYQSHGRVHQHLQMYQDLCVCGCTSTEIAQASATRHPLALAGGANSCGCSCTGIHSRITECNAYEYACKSALTSGESNPSTTKRADIVWAHRNPVASTPTSMPKVVVICTISSAGIPTRGSLLPYLL